MYTEPDVTKEGLNKTVWNVNPKYVPTNPHHEAHFARSYAEATNLIRNSVRWNDGYYMKYPICCVGSGTRMMNKKFPEAVYLIPNLGPQDAVRQ